MQKTTLDLTEEDLSLAEKRRISDTEIEIFKAYGYKPISFSMTSFCYKTETFDDITIDVHKSELVQDEMSSALRTSGHDGLRRVNIRRRELEGESL